MPFFLSDFIQEHKTVELLLDVTNESKVIESLEENEVDFALVSILPTHLQFEKIDLLQNKLFLVGNSKALDTTEAKGKQILEELPLIFREKGSGTRQTMERFIEKNNLSVVKKMELTSNEAVKQALVAGLGYSIMPLIGIKNEIENNELAIISIPGLPIQTTWSLVWLKGKKPHPVAQSFLSFLNDQKSSIINEKFSWYEKY